jgi:hypothetical protein
MKDLEKREYLADEVLDGAGFIVTQLTRDDIDKDAVESTLDNMEDSIRAIRRYLRMI